MIPVQRIAAPAATQRLLTRRLDNVRDRGGTAAAARDEWGRARAAKQHVQELLHRMAHGVRRCMYCEDSLGTDIDHFQPIATAPLRAFDWPNHLLACSHCNSNQKRDAYPRDADGNCLLVDPSAEDPSDHLTLLLASGTYLARTPKGEETIRVFALNRVDLVQGRRAAFRMASAALCQWRSLRENGEPGEAEQLADALRMSPFAGVMRSMALLPDTVALGVLGATTAEALDAWLSSHGT